MKKILLGTIVLLAFSLAAVITQMSCKKEAVAQASAIGFEPLNKVLYLKSMDANDPSIVATEIWIKDLVAGTAAKVNVVVPDGYRIVQAQLSPDGKKIAYSVLIRQNVSQDGMIYTCNADGSSPVKIAEGNLSNGLVQLQGIY